MTSYRYDRAGRLVQAVTEREAEWDEQERAWMLAWSYYTASVHEPCGTYLPDATGPQAEGAFKAKLPVRCHVCTTRFEAYAVHTKGSHAAHPEALLWPVVPRGG